MAYEISHIVQDGIRRMYGASQDHPHGEDIIYYLTVYNEPIVQPKEPENLDVEGLLKGIYHYAVPPEVDAENPPRVQLLASGVGFPWIAQAQRMLAEDWGVAADTWSVTSWNELARDAVAAEEWNLLHPSEPAHVPYVSDKLKAVEGPVVAVSDYMRAVPNQIAKWVPADFYALGTDGFGFADTRPAARRFFHVDAQSVVVQALQALADRGEVKQETVQEAFDRYRIDDPTAVADVKQEGGDA
jgi:pyruvate dehydrogenase E1 component